MPYPRKRITAECPQCHRDFTYKPSGPRQHCSRACLSAAKRTTTICPACGKEFWYHRSWPRVHCSRQCAGRQTVINFPGFTPTSQPAQCEQCGTTFQYRANERRGRFCTMTCYREWNAAHRKAPLRVPAFRRGPRPARVALTCDICGNGFTAKPSELPRRRYCSRVCAAHQASASGRMAGANNINWRGGYEPYYGPSWHPAKRAVRLRDPICQRCCMLPETNGRALDVHHLIPFREFGAARHAEANALSNLIALCHDCHLLFEWQSNRRAVHPVSHR